MTFMSGSGLAVQPMATRSGLPSTILPDRQEVSRGLTHEKCQSSSNGLRCGFAGLFAKALG